MSSTWVCKSGHLGNIGVLQLWAALLLIWPSLNLLSFLSKILVVFVKWRTKPSHVGKTADAFDTVFIDMCSYKICFTCVSSTPRQNSTFPEEMGLSPSFLFWVQTLQVIVHAFQVDWCSILVPVFMSIIWKTPVCRKKCLRTVNKLIFSFAKCKTVTVI